MGDLILAIIISFGVGAFLGAWFGYDMSVKTCKKLIKKEIFRKS